MKILDHLQQGSQEWLDQRCGKITMSHAKELLTGGKGKTRESYLLDVVAERLSGQPIEGYYGLDMQRGNFLEDWALKAVEQQLGVKLRKVGLIISDDGRIACSPDALGDGYGVEIKCPDPRQHLRNILGKGMQDYKPQCQGGMWVTGYEGWILASFCPWVTQCPLIMVTVDRDQGIIDKLEESAISGADFVDMAAKSVNSDHLDPSILEQSVKARAAWESACAEKSEVIL